MNIDLERFKHVTLNPIQIATIHLLGTFEMDLIDYKLIEIYTGDGAAMFEFKKDGFIVYHTKSLKESGIL